MARTCISTTVALSAAVGTIAAWGICPRGRAKSKSDLHPRLHTRAGSGATLSTWKSSCCCSASSVGEEERPSRSYAKASSEACGRFAEIIRRDIRRDGWCIRRRDPNGYLARSEAVGLEPSLHRRLGDFLGDLGDIIAEIRRDRVAIGDRVPKGNEKRRGAVQGGVAARRVHAPADDIVV